MRNIYKILVGKHEGPFERFRRRCEDNIKMGLKRNRVRFVD
jgi:hypothetical protein